MNGVGLPDKKTVKKQKRRWYWVACCVGMIFLLGLAGVPVQAAYEGMEHVSMSPDGNAFTTHAGETNTKWYERGLEVYTGVKSSLENPKVGEHEYAREREDVVSIGKWVVMHPYAKCVHDTYPTGDYYYGISFGRQKCLQAYYSGWFAYCADCGEAVTDKLFYMSDETAKKLTYLDLAKGYYYKCPHCDNLEQGCVLQKHICKGISANRYYVRYHANFGNGYMEKSVHMVNNASIYEGQEVTPQTTLNLNTYTRRGYEFVGWNTEKDGSGKSYGDGAVIYNLSMEENASVILYAQWKKSISRLEIDPAGGSYEGKYGITQVEGEYGSVYSVDRLKLVAPKGYTVHFDTMGGEKLADKVGTQSFQEWSCQQPFSGKWEEEQYLFSGADGTVDRITATYVADPIVLPQASREGYAFGGWFMDEECTQPVGMAGNSFVPQKETTLYACWVELQLQAADNYTANKGKGAVNLTWNQKDNQAKVYQIYQRTDATDWLQICAAEEKANTYQVYDSITFSGENGTYVVPYSGFYTLTLTGAQGADYGSYLGGKGGMVQGTIYLEKGEKLTYVLGGQNGFSGGGTGNPYGNGGGFSSVSNAKNGTLLIAGGGGGASNLENGGAGGSLAQVISTGNGQDGVSGGGGGYKGGIAGEIEVHEHTDVCRHTHTGSPTSYGGCYTIPIACGGKDFTKVEASRKFYYGNVDNNGNHIVCVRCGSDSCSGHLDIIWNYVCNTCKTTYQSNPSQCTAMTVYGLGCEREESYVCGMREGQILQHQPAYGGSNYIHTTCFIQYTEEAGVQSGNGTLLIQSEQIGLLDTNQLNGVTATDLAEPDKIEAGSICKTAVSEKEIRVSFARPSDNGTDYYHRVESFSKETHELICTSNQTKNTLTSGIAGYRYVVDNNDSTVVYEAHDFCEEKGTEPFVVVTSEATAKYLHIAAEDKAGNIGPTTHVRISNQDVVYWPLITEKLKLEEGSNVFQAEAEDTYFVKADGNTPFGITLEGLLCGTARKDYQINCSNYRIQDLSEEASAGSLSIITPNREQVSTGTHTYSMQQLQKKQEGNIGLQDASYTISKRFNGCRSLIMVQKFTLPSNKDGHKYQVIPQVAAMGEEETVYSEESRDLQNSIYLIADGKAPAIQGAEKLQQSEGPSNEEGQHREVDILASDTGSGLAQFYVEVQNSDNGCVVRYEDEALTGKIHLVISEEEPVFQGKFTVIVYAVDKVGNEIALHNDLLGVGLKAYVERVLEPHTPLFKKGESGVLYIKALGYIEKLEISFPEVFVEEEESLNRSIVYDVPNLIQTEEIPFQVPLGTPEGEMTIQVKAYKAGTELEATPQVVTIKVEGSILDELHTRLR